MPTDPLHQAAPWQMVCCATRALRAVMVWAWYAGLCAALLHLAGCATAPPASPSSTPLTVSAPDPVGKLTPGQAQDVTLYAMTLVGTPYRYGGNTPQSGFDCSGLIGHVYQTHTGQVPPRSTTRLQFWGNAVVPEHVRMGDLVVFLNSNNAATHAGIYVGSNRFVHAPSTGGVVRLDSLTTKHWASQTMLVRRP